MIQQRIQEEDCNAGAIFDCLESPNWPNLKFALDCLCEAIPKQNIQVLLFQFVRESHEDNKEQQLQVPPPVEEAKAKT